MFQKWIDKNFFLTPVTPTQNTFRIRYLELIADNIYKKYGKYQLTKINTNEINIYNLINGNIEKKDNIIVFDQKKDFVEYLYTNLFSIEEYLSINLLNWIFDYSNLFLNNPYAEEEIKNIIYNFNILFPSIKIEDYNNIVLLSEYMDYYLSDLLIDKNIDYVESSLIFEIKQAIIAMILFYNENQTLKGFIEELQNIGNPIDIYYSIYKKDLVQILNKILLSK